MENAGVILGKKIDLIFAGTLEGYKEDGRWWVQVPDNGQSQPETKVNGEYLARS